MENSSVFRIKCKQKNTQMRVVIALTLLCLVICTINVQLYLEYQIAVNIASPTITYADKLNHPVNYFDMSISELMEVVVVS